MALRVPVDDRQPWRTEAGNDLERPCAAPAPAANRLSRTARGYAWEGIAARIMQLYADIAHLWLGAQFVSEWLKPASQVLAQRRTFR